MPIRKFALAIVCSGYCLLSPWHAAAETLQIISATTVAEVTGVPSQREDDFPSATASAALPGYASTTAWDYTTSDGAASFTTTFDQARSGTGFSFGASSVAFSPSLDVTYEISGTFTGTAGFTVLYAQLYDATADTILLDNYQTAVGGPATFALGVANGPSDTLEGSLAGMLLAGHSYYWTASAYTQAFPVADGGAAGSGSALMLLSFGTVQTVPEPSTIVLLATTLGPGFLIGLVRLRNRQQQSR